MEVLDFCSLFMCRHVQWKYAAKAAHRPRVGQG